MNLIISFLFKPYLGFHNYLIILIILADDFRIAENLVLNKNIEKHSRPNY